MRMQFAPPPPRHMHTKVAISFSPIRSSEQKEIHVLYISQGRQLN